jgi:hypothetical protein
VAKNKKPKAKPESFRQRLRTKAQSRLEKILDDADNAIMDSVNSNDTEINRHDVMRLLSGTQTKTLREQLITELANENEAALEAIYNKQIDLLPEDDSGDEKEG